MESTDSLIHTEATPSLVEHKYSIRQCRNQILASAIVTLGGFAIGTVIGWCAVAEEELVKQPEFRDVEENEIAWVASLAILGAIFASPVAGWMMDALGRKKSVIIFSLPFTLGWVAMCLGLYTHQFLLLCIGRTVTGFCAGANLVIVPIYIKEMAAEPLAAVLEISMSLMFVIGILYSLVIWAYTHWIMLTACCGVIPALLGIGTLLIVPESPRFLLVKNQRQKAIASIKWLYRLSSDEIAEETLIRVFSKVDMRETSTSAKKSMKDLLTRRIGYPILITVLLMFFQGFGGGGINAISMYTVEIFNVSGTATIQHHLTTIMVGVCLVLFAFVPLFLINRTGRKVLFISCSVIMGFGLLLLGIYIHAKEKSKGEDPSENWLLLASTLVYIGAYSAGVGPVPWVMVSELYNPNYRSESATIMTTFFWIFAWIVKETHENLKKSTMNASVPFYVYAGFCFGGALFTLVFVPETRGKSEEEIQEYFGGKKTHEEKEEEHHGREVGAGGDGDSNNWSGTTWSGSESYSEAELEGRKKVVVVNKKTLNDYVNLES